MSSLLVNHTEFTYLHAQVSQWSNRSRIARSYGPGTHRSSFRGQGLETIDSRPYHPGDNIRHMDWRATARSGKAISKVFMDERQHNLFLIIDRRPAMFFGTRNMLKVTAAVKTAAVLAFSAIVNHDRAGGIIVDDQHDLFPSTRDINTTLKLLTAAAAPQIQNTTQQDEALSKAFAAALTTAPNSTTICLISDCDFVSKPNQHKEFYALLDKYPMQVFQITDPAEFILNDVGKLRIASPDGTETCTIDTSNKQVRDAYALQAAEQQKHIRLQLLKWGVRHHTIQTKHDILKQLETLI